MNDNTSLANLVGAIRELREEEGLDEDDLAATADITRREAARP
jgi:DNA-binding XRE family transcriptional regulator